MLCASQMSVGSEPGGLRPTGSPVAGRRSAGPDHELPLKYQRDPWRWEPRLGFHRTSAPNSVVLLRAGTGQRVVGPDLIGPYQALRLGYGLGMGSTAGDLAEFVRRFCEISSHVGHLLLR